MIVGFLRNEMNCLIQTKHIVVSLRLASCRQPYFLNSKLNLKRPSRTHLESHQYRNSDFIMRYNFTKHVPSVHCGVFLLLCGLRSEVSSVYESINEFYQITSQDK